MGSSAPGRIYPVVVVGGDYPSTPSTRAAIQQELASRQLKVIGRDPRCREAVAIDACELRHLIAAASATGRLLPDIIEEWISSPLVGVGLWRWLGKCFSPYDSPAQTWIADAARWAGIPTNKESGT